MGVEPFLSKAEAATDHAVDLAKVLEDTRKALVKAAEQMRMSADMSRSNTPSYSVGCPSRKLTKRWIGPYKIVSLKPNAVELKL
ncbi:hypothetical protein M404DRAFT_67434, partial [Pisolithus tinctorius Marx 270]